MGHKTADLKVTKMTYDGWVTEGSMVYNSDILYILFLPAIWTFSYNPNALKVVEERKNN